MNFKEAIANKIARSSSDIVYPTYFGGTYLDEEKNPVILTTDMTKQGLIKELAGSDAVIVKPCTYSYQYLHDIDNRIIDCLRKRPELLEQVGINRFGVISDENYINVTLVSCTPEKINLFKSLIIDEPVIRFSEDPSIMTLASASTDSRVKAASTTRSGFVDVLFIGEGLLAGGIYVQAGYRAKNGSIEGYVSSGHVASLAGGEFTDMYYPGKSEPVGRIVTSCIGFSVDASFCQVYSNSGIMVLSEFSNCQPVAPTCIDPQMYAQIGMNYSSGIITKTSVTVSYSVDNTRYIISDCGEAT